MQEQARRKYSKKERVIFVFLAVVIGLGTLEITARLVRSIMPEWFSLASERDHQLSLEPDPNLLWKLSPGTGHKFDTEIRVNSQGMRGAELQVPKPDDNFRILFLGDSSVFGQGVTEEKAFPYLLKTILASDSTVEIEIANAAVPGYSSTQCRILFDKHKDSIRPDAIVVTPIWSDMMILKWSDKELLKLFDEVPFYTQKVILKSVLAQFFYHRILESKGIKEKRRLALHSIFNYKPDSSFHAIKRVDPEEHRQNLVSIVSEAKKRGIKVMMIILPCKHEKEVDATNAAIVGPYRENYREIATKYNVALLDMPSVFSSRATKDTATLFLDGLHPNEEGHKIIAMKAAKVFRKWLEKVK